LKHDADPMVERHGMYGMQPNGKETKEKKFQIIDRLIDWIVIKKKKKSSCNLWTIDELIEFSLSLYFCFLFVFTKWFVVEKRRNLDGDSLPPAGSLPVISIPCSMFLLYYIIYYMIVSWVFSCLCFLKLNWFDFCVPNRCVFVFSFFNFFPFFFFLSCVVFRFLFLSLERSWEMKRKKKKLENILYHVV